MKEESLTPEQPFRSPGSSSSLPTYSVLQYRKNAEAIKQINEWLLRELYEQLQRERDRLTISENNLELQRKHNSTNYQLLLDARQMLAQREKELSLARLELNQLTDASLGQFILNVLSTSLIGFGTNLATGSELVWVGWVMVGVGIIILSVSFLMTRQAKKRARI